LTLFQPGGGSFSCPFSNFEFSNFLFPLTLALRRFRARLGQRLARHHFVAVRGQIDESGHNHCHLLHVQLLDTFVDVHVGVVRARVVI
jgi:hypothetical protein